MGRVFNFDVVISKVCIEGVEFGFIEVLFNYH
jgi:hypothetical protein